MKSNQLMLKNTQYNKFSYDEHAKKCDPTDLHGQVLRTVKGKPLDQVQIQIIINRIKSGLSLKSNDVVLDLACGNGSISEYLFQECKGYLGVDVSTYLIDIANTNFKKNADYMFKSSAVLSYLNNENNPERFTKLLIFAAFQYFTDEEAIEILTLIQKKFINVSVIFLGNMPDLERSKVFYHDSQPSIEELGDHQTAIGKWRTEEQLSYLAELSGWNSCFPKIKDDFYASNYRFDVNLFKDGRAKD